MENSVLPGQDYLLVGTGSNFKMSIWLCVCDVCMLMCDMCMLTFCIVHALCRQVSKYLQGPHDAPSVKIVTHFNDMA